MTGKKSNEKKNLERFNWKKINKIDFNLAKLIIT